MTALAGYWAFSGDDPARACTRMLAAQALYGRDGALVGSGSGAGDVALGRALFLTLPEDRFDRGVQVGAGGRYTLVADARIDNREDLIRALGLDPGHAARSCDAAIILAAIERWGEDGIARLIGDFAIVLWDATRCSLLLARDYAGARPLHYHVARGFVAVASMPKGLHALAEVPRRPHEPALVDFLAGYADAGTATVYEGVQRVERGAVVTITRAGVTSRRYWRPPETRLKLAEPAAYEEGLREQLDRAVACRLRRAAGGIGSHLSAGLDSSAVASTAARRLGDEPLVAYTAVPMPGAVAADGRLTDEGAIAAAVAALHPNIEHRMIAGAGESPLDRLDRAFHLFDAPVLSPTNFVWADRIAADAAERGLSVMLTGQLGNITISHDGTSYLAELLGAGRIPTLLRMGQELRRGGMRWRGVAAMAAAPYLPRGLWRAFAARVGKLPPTAGHAALAPALLAEIDARPPSVEAVALDRQPWRNGRARRLMMLDQTDPGNFYKGLLGGHGVDHRDPTADRRLLEYCLAVPEEQFILNGVPRSLARRAFADRLPPVLLGERRKGLQGADWHVGLIAAAPAITDEIERLAETPQAQFLDIARLRTDAARLVADPAGVRADPAEHRIALLRALSVGHFARRAGGSNH